MKTPFIYKVRILLAICISLISCRKEDSGLLPTIITYIPKYVASTSATIGCTIKSDGGSDFLAGLYIGLNENPEAGGNQFQFATDTGTFLARVTGLMPGAHYYLKAYIKNAKEEKLGDQVVFITPGTVSDYENNIYETVKIVNQLWMAGNLKTTHYLNGDPIPTTNPSSLDISGEESPKYQWSYNGVDDNSNTYGKLYTWHVVTDPRKVCPSGWHIPSDAEWTALESALGGFENAGSKLKEDGNSHWISPYNTDATNESCFSALPGGYRSSTGVFSYIENYGYWWSSTEGDVASAWMRSLFVQASQTFRTAYLKKHGVSVRCIAD